MKRSLIHCALLAGLVAGTAQAQVQAGNGADASELGATAVGDLAGAKEAATPRLATPQMRMVGPPYWPLHWCDRSGCLRLCTRVQYLFFWGF